METFIASPEKKCSHCETGYIYQATELEVFCLTCGNQLSSDPNLAHSYQGHGWDTWITKERSRASPQDAPKIDTRWTPEITFPNPDPREKNMGRKEKREYRVKKLKTLLKAYPKISQAEAMRVTGWIRPSLMIYADLIGHRFEFKQGGRVTAEEKKRRTEIVTRRLRKDPSLSSIEIAQQENIPRSVVQKIAKHIGHQFQHWVNRGKAHHWYQTKWSDQQVNIWKESR